MSIVSQVYNCQDTLEELHSQITEVLSELGFSYEIIFVNDASLDKSWEVIKSLKKRDNHVIGINFRRKYGTSAALQAAFDIAKGEYVFTLSPTLENSPQELKILLATLEARDLDLVVGRREGKMKGRFWRSVMANLGNNLISRVCGASLSDVTSPIRLIRLDIVKKMRLYGDQHSFLPAVATLYGAKIEEVSIKHYKPRNPDTVEKTVSPFKMLLDLLVLKLILSFSTPPFTSPMRIFGTGGIISTLLGTLITLYLMYVKFLLGQDIGTRPLLQFGVLGIIIGVQFLALGVIGDLMFHTYFESQDRRIYTVKEELI